MSSFVNVIGRLSAPLMLASLVAMAVGFAGLGWEVGRAPLQVQLARLSADHATEKTQLALHALATLKEAQARGDALSTGLLNQQTQIDQLKTQAHHAITQATTGKPCLNGAALRLLDNAPGIDIAGLPPAPGSAAATGESFATDTDLAVWLVDAGAAYQTCRARLDALIDWHTPTLNSAMP